MQNTPVQVNSLEPSMPAARAGLHPNDKILSIDGLHLHSVTALLGYLQDQAGKPASLEVQRTASPAASPVRLSTASGAAYELGMREKDHGMPIQPFPDG